ncbi:hypothetical protein [Crateriforma conspicua]|uniref:Uncharacterized protein n=1 Tax=Crateriforma conspicua TaxID=2527996 RepID=A0A5C5YC96_9PLAN|nr:hypothetical protein [Crateriforma conspicua]TWT72549.1 hypothetical protein Pan14r_48690 [Crateriforma conspicua]
MSEKRESRGLSCMAKLLIAVFVAPLVLVLIVVTWWLGRNAFAQGRLDDALATLAADGQPIDATSHQQYYASHSSDALSDRWTALTSHVETPDFQQDARGMPILGGGDDVPPAGSDWQDESTVRDFLQSQKPVFDELAILAASPGAVRYPIAFNNANARLQHQQACRALARLLTLRHRVAMRDGDGAEATESTTQTLAVARSLQGTPDVITQLIRIAILQISLQQIRIGLDHDVYAVPQLNRLLKEVDRRGDPLDELRQAMIGERSMMLTNLRNLPGGGGLGKRPFDALATLELFEKTLGQIGGDMHTTDEKIQQLSTQLDSEYAQADWLSKIDRALTEMSRPSLVAISKAFARSETTAAVVSAGMLIQRSASQRGSWPSPDEFKQTIAPEDSGIRHSLPLQYRTDDESTAVIWLGPMRRPDQMTEGLEDADPLENAKAYEDAWWVVRVKRSPLVKD